MNSFKTYEETYETPEKLNMERVTYDIQNIDVFREILKRYKIVVVDVWANFCAPCKTFSPLYEDLARGYMKEIDSKNLLFLKDCIDDDNYDSLHGGETRAVPTFFIYMNGKVIGTVLGANMTKIKRVIDILINVDNPNVLEEKLSYIYDEKLLEKNEKIINNINDRNIGVC
jgi:thioredoxin 1